MQLDEITLRRAYLDDATALALVGAATFLETFAGVLDAEAILGHCARQHSIEAHAKYLSQPTTRAWLAEMREGAAPVGYAVLTEPDLPLNSLTPEDIELKRIYLFSRFHGTGTGKRLFDQAVSEARAMGRRRLLLGVYAENHRGLAFYRKNGFETVGTRTFQVGNRLCDDLVLARPL